MQSLRRLPCSQRPEPPLEAKVEIKQEFDDVEDPGEEDYSLQ